VGERFIFGFLGCFRANCAARLDQGQSAYPWNPAEGRPLPSIHRQLARPSATPECCAERGRSGFAARPAATESRRTTPLVDRNTSCCAKRRARCCVCCDIDGDSNPGAIAWSPRLPAHASRSSVPTTRLRRERDDEKRRAVWTTSCHLRECSPCRPCFVVSLPQ
jgi:hypothetical protein